MRKWSLFGVVLTVGLMLVCLPAPQVQAQTAEERAEIQAAAAVGEPPAPVQTWEVEAPEAVIFFTNFEADNGGFSGTLDWQWGTYAFTPGTGCAGSIAPPPAPYSGSRMWGTVLNDCYTGLANNSGYDTCVNGNTADDSILSFTFDLTGYTEASLFWWEWNDLYLYWDWGEVYANGTVIFQHCGGSYSAPTAWVRQGVSLTPYVGGVVTIEFHMMASSVVNYSGWYIDNVFITDQPVPVELQTFSIE